MACLFSSDHLVPAWRASRSSQTAACHQQRPHHDAWQQRELPAQRLCTTIICAVSRLPRRPGIDVQVAVALAGALSVPLS